MERQNKQDQRENNIPRITYQGIPKNGFSGLSVASISSKCFSLETIGRYRKTVNRIVPVGTVAPLVVPTNA